MNGVDKGNINWGDIIRIELDNMRGGANFQ